MLKWQLAALHVNSDISTDELRRLMKIFTSQCTDVTFSTSNTYFLPSLSCQLLYPSRLCVSKYLLQLLTLLFIFKGMFCLPSVLDVQWLRMPGTISCIDCCITKEYTSTSIRFTTSLWYVFLDLIWLLLVHADSYSLFKDFIWQTQGFYIFLTVAFLWAQHRAQPSILLLDAPAVLWFYFKRVKGCTFNSVVCLLGGKDAIGFLVVAAHHFALLQTDECVVMCLDLQQ